MALLSYADICKVLELGLIKIDPAPEEINATSIDIHLKKLFRPKYPEGVEAISLDTPITYEEVPMESYKGEKVWVIRPRDFFHFTTIEKFTMQTPFTGQIHSRSSWARYGLDVKSCDEGFSMPTPDVFDEQVRGVIRTLGTELILRPEDAIGQAHLFYMTNEPILDVLMEHLIQEGFLKIELDGKEVKALVQTYILNGKPTVLPGNPHEIDRKRKHRESRFHRVGGGYTLTLDDTIHLYKGGTIDPHNFDPSLFTTVHLDPEGIGILKDTFFLSASAETVQIDNRFVGWVEEYNHIIQTSGYHGLGIQPFERGLTMQTHAGAPKIDPWPRFRGKITFENQAWEDLVLIPGERLADFHLFCLESPYEGNQESRYCNQKSATISKGSQDYQKK